MIEVHPFTFYGLIALSAMGMISAAYTLWEHNKGPEGFLQKPDAPDGHEWVLMTTQDAASWRKHPPGQ